MNWEVDILDTHNLRFEGDFDAQVQDILSFVRLTADRVHNLRRLFDDLKQALQHVAPGCNIEPFGSVVTGLGIKTSDVDCYIALPNGEQPHTGHVIRARNVLTRYHRKFSEIIAITTARVPIVKFLHIPTQCQCDVNFKSPAGVRNSQLIAFLLQYDKRALPLAVLIKYWSKVHKFTGTNLMGNYALIMMLIFYLQLMNILPSVYELQRNMPEYFVDGWNTAFDDSVTSSNTRNSDTLYELLGGFFKCYSTFNYKENMISPFLGRVINKKSFENFDIPEEFSLYKNQVTKDVRKKLKTDSKFCVQDPFEHNKNISVSIFDRLAERITSHFQFASKKFEDEESTNFLRAIFTQDPHSAAAAPVNPKHKFNNKIKKRKQKNRGVPNQTGFRMMYNQYNQTIAKGNQNNSLKPEN
ncbi:hypothetical protein PYW07_012489 [Mythimna separata]|uniref:Uncharacterized protein n=1 Tax=Mythimna separata TaxID=271217 RepID=A0AAD7YLT1_MYTSE|nr:hypothetical protein PYW07_012489 [Mythimna separata]